MSSISDSKPLDNSETIQSETLGAYEAAVGQTLKSLEEKSCASRLWAKDPTLWKSRDPQAVLDRLGWLTAHEAMTGEVPALVSFAEEVKKSGFTQAVLLGMGGSSLCAEVLRQTFGVSPGFLDLQVLDSTDPAAVLGVEESVPLPKTLFIVSTKSGTTTETLALFEYFFEKVKAARGETAGEQFVAITDPGSPLEKVARERRFLRAFLNPTDIGGRYSALSFFGLVPAALAGVDGAALLGRAQNLASACAPSVPAQRNPALKLGAVLAALAEKGRDKVTFILSPALVSFGSWVEQLLAESTGKEGKGLTPVVGEPLGSPSAYGDDRLFVCLGLMSDRGEETKLQAIEEAGHPVVRIALHDALDLGGEFLRWEIATAVAGAVMEINPFDEPDVQGSKDATKRLLREFSERGAFSEGVPLVQESRIAAYGDESAVAAMKPSGRDLRGLLAAHLGQARPGDYVALLAYLARSPEHDGFLDEIRRLLRDKLHVATTLGYGPRYLHSTGQLHKGGPNNGLFIEITADPERDLPIPGERYSFGVLERAQALGDFLSLRNKDRRIVRLHLGKETAGGLQRVLAATRAIAVG